MKAIFSPGPSYFDSEVRKFAGWTHILDLYREGLEELGYEVFVPEVDPKLIDLASTVSKILSYDLVAASQLPLDADLFLGPPGYSLAQMMKLKDRSVTTSEFEAGIGPKLFLYVWNNSDWWRDQQLEEEYKRFGQPYDMSPTWRWINRTALETCDHVIACSPWVKMTHAKVVPEDKISIAFWGVDSQKFSPPEVEPPGFNVLFVGGDPIRKGLFYLMRALEGMENVELWIAGCSPFHDAHPLVKIRQFGMVPHSQMLDIMRQCHMLICPTLEDGIALCVQEAMASGLSVITSPETAEVFEHMETGIKVDYRDTEGIKRALLFLRDNPVQRVSMGKKARALAETQTWEMTKGQFKEVIRERA